MDLRLKCVDRWEKGYQKFSLSQRVHDLGLGSYLDDLRSLYFDLDPDPYDKRGVRYRAYGRGAFYPWKNTFEWFPDEEIGDSIYARYYQGNHNPEHVNAWRQFSAIPERIKSNPVLTEIVMNAALRAAFEGCNYVRPIGVGIHLVRQLVNSEHPVATVSPDVMHQDGEMYDYVHLVERSGVVGGASVISSVSAAGTPPQSLFADDIIDKFTLTETLEGFGVRDEYVSHGVEPVSLADNSTEGYRHTILVDLTPMYEKLR